LWIVRINAAACLNGTTYSRLVGALHKAGVAIDRKILADLALSLPGDFPSVVRAAQA
jgi:large subunit ribosomal protein L20